MRYGRRMSGNDNSRSDRVTVACAWCGAVRELSAEELSGSGRKGELIDTICPDCEADFRSLSNAPKAMRAPARPPIHTETESDSSSSEWLTRRGRRLRLAWLTIFATMLVACGAGRSQQAWTMPSPDGCFVQVWDGPSFQGVSEFINGPRRYEHLRDLPGRLSWKGRIRSLRLGPSASAIAWSSERFEGRNLPLTTDNRHADRFATLPVDVESLDIRCSGADTLLADTAAVPQP
jgi:hypothetical protein